MTKELLTPSTKWSDRGMKGAVVVPGLAGASGSADANDDNVAVLALVQLLDRLHEQVEAAVEGLRQHGRNGLARRIEEEWEE
jgi:hypothetical protein